MEVSHFRTAKEICYTAVLTSFGIDISYVYNCLLK